MISLCGPGRLVIFSQTVRSRAAVLIFTWWSASLFQGRHTVTTPPALGSLCGKVRMSDVTLSLIWGLPELYYFIKWSPLSESLPPPHLLSFFPHLFWNYHSVFCSLNDNRTYHHILEKMDSLSYSVSKGIGTFKGLCDTVLKAIFWLRLRHPTVTCSSLPDCPSFL